MCVCVRTRARACMCKTTNWEICALQQGTVQGNNNIVKGKYAPKLACPMFGIEQPADVFRVRHSLPVSK